MDILEFHQRHVILSRTIKVNAKVIKVIIMDTQKYNNPQLNDTNNPVVSKKSDSVSFFDEDEDFSFVYKKTEKLTTAIYMVTNLFPDSEPMKWSLRKKMSDFLSYTIGYKDINLSQQIEFLERLKTFIMEIDSMLSITSYSGLVSSMNFSIIQQEFFNLVAFLNKLKFSHKESSHNSLSKSFFDVGAVPSEGVDYDKTTRSQIFLKDTKKSSDENTVKRTNRQSTILQMLKKKKELTIKDISQVIKDCSEKTIQRELIMLISAGVLKKTGERRWSKYSLK